MADGQTPKVKRAPPRFVYPEGSIPSAHASFSKPPLHPLDPEYKKREKRVVVHTPRAKNPKGAGA